MANTRTFLGFKQVLKAEYDAAEEKVGYLWLVRESADSAYGDLYFGTRHYGHFGTEAEDIEAINDVLVDAGIVDESGNTVDILTLIQNAQLEPADGSIVISGDTIASTAKSKTTTDIYIQDGAIDASGLWADNKIPAGTSVEDILIKLLRTEKWNASAVATSSSFTVSIGSLSVTFSKSSNVEVGDAITINAVNAASTSASQSYVVKTFDYGYSLNDKDHPVSDTSYSLPVTPTVSDSTVTMKEDISGFVDADGEAIKSLGAGATTSLTSLSAYAVEGTNKVTVYQTGATYASEAVESKTFYIPTNVGNFTKSATDSSDNIYVSDAVASTTSSKSTSKSASIDAKYAYFYGFIEAATDYSDTYNSKASLSSFTKAFMSSSAGATATITSITSTDAKPYIALVIPSSWSITGTKNKLGSAVTVSTTWTKMNSFDYVNGNATTNYTLYVIKSAEGTMYQTIAISK